MSGLAGDRTTIGNAISGVNDLATATTGLLTKEPDVAGPHALLDVLVPASDEHPAAGSDRHAGQASSPGEGSSRPMRLPVTW